MQNNPVPSAFAHFVRNYLNVDAVSLDSLRQYVLSNADKQMVRDFRKELADAIMFKTISPKDYERLTDEDFDTQEELQDWLMEVWNALYGDAPVTIS